MEFSRPEYWSGAFPFSRGFSPGFFQGLNPGLPHRGQILYQLSHKGSLKSGIKINLPSLVLNKSSRLRIHTRLGSREASKESGAKNLELALVPSTKDLRSDFWNLGTAFNNIDQRNCFLQPAVCLKVYIQLLNTLLNSGCMHTQSLQLCLTLCNPMGWARQAPLSIVSSRQEYWRGLPCPPAGDLPWSGIEPNLLHLLHWGRALFCWATRRSHWVI